MISTRKKPAGLRREHPAASRSHRSRSREASWCLSLGAGSGWWFSGHWNWGIVHHSTIVWWFSSWGMFLGFQPGSSMGVIRWSVCGCNWSMNINDGWLIGSSIPPPFFTELSLTKKGNPVNQAVLVRKGPTDGKPVSSSLELEGCLNVYHHFGLQYILLS